MRSQEEPGEARRSQKSRGGLGGARGSQEEPGRVRGARGSQKKPGGARRSQDEPGEEPGGARESRQAEPGGARRSQQEPGGEEPAGARSSLCSPTPQGRELKGVNLSRKFEWAQERISGLRPIKDSKEEGGRPPCYVWFNWFGNKPSSNPLQIL